MKHQQLVSLLLAGQMLTAPVAQAASLSHLEAARRKSAVHAMAMTADVMKLVSKKGYQRLQVTQALLSETSKTNEAADAESSFGGAVSTAEVDGITSSVPASALETMPVVISEETVPSAPAETPTVTPGETESPAPVETPTVTPVETESPTPVETPTVTPVETESPAPVETPTVTPGENESPVPEETPTLAPEETMSPVPETTLSPVLQEEQMALYAQRDVEVPAFTYAYVGFGYEELMAGLPSEDGSVKEAESKWVTLFDENHIPSGKGFTAQIAVEKPEGSQKDMGGLAKIEIYPENWEEDVWSWGWVSREDGSYSLDDLNLWLSRNDKAPVNIKDLDALLGRIPDHQFDGWYVSKMGPKQTNAISTGQRDTFWTYNTEQCDPPNANHQRPACYKIPIYYCQYDDDYKLEEGSIDIEKIDEAVINDVNKIDTTYNYMITNIYTYEPGEWGTRDLPIIAGWKLSDDATLIDSAECNAAPGEEYKTKKTVMYTVKKGEGSEEVTDVDLLSEFEIYDRHLADEEKKLVDKVDFSDSGVYYLRVNSDVEGILPELIAAEAFLTTSEEDTAKTPGVTISLRQAGETEAKVYDCSKELINGAKVDDDGKTWLYNNSQYPMRSLWTLEDGEDGKAGYLPLAITKGSENVTDYYNEIVITVTAPDGESQKTHTFYVQRLSDPVLVRNPGNTPLGMIQRNTRENWQSKDHIMPVEDMVAEAIQRFTNGYKNGPAYSFNAGVGSLYIPTDSVENNGGWYENNKVYHPQAWLSAGLGNIDLDPTAIVVYPDSSFVDPGFTLYDGQGDVVAFDPAQGNVRRSVELRVSNAAGGLGIWDVADGAGDECYYDAAGNMTQKTEGTNTFQVVRNADGKDQIDLRGVKVIPGVYTMEYEFEDPLSGRVYSSTTEENFIDKEKENWKSFRRTLVVLPMPGDVDMDGAVTGIDADLLEQALQALTTGGDSFLSAGRGSIAEVYRYRVCDVNNDGVVDTNDVAMIRSGYNPRFSRNTTCTGYYYIPLHTGPGALEDVDRYERQSWAGNKVVEAGKAGITLEYLGKNTPEITADPSKLDEIKNTDENGDPAGLKSGDIFWVGVKMSNWEALGADDAMRNGIVSLDLSVIYNMKYIKPVLPDGTLVTETKQDEWREMLKRYNIEPGSTTTNHRYLWPGGLYELSTDGTLTTGDYTAPSSHYSVPKMPREESEKKKWVMERRLAFSINAVNGGIAYRVLNSSGGGDPYLLRIPFQVTSVPFKVDFLEALDLELGMRGLSVTVDRGGNEITAAWNSAGENFGGSTRNLADELTYIDGSARALPLAKAELNETVLVNSRNDGKTVYGETYEYTNPTLLGNQTTIADNLPKGLSYLPTIGRITGIPEEIGEFLFEVESGNFNSTICSIVVEKAPLHIAAVGQERFYGEPNAKLDYMYDKSDIKSPDLPGGGNYVEGFTNDASSAQLSKLSGYSAPVLTTKAVQSSDTGSYTIEMTAATDGKSGLTNYTFIYVNGKLTSDGKTELTETVGKTVTTPLVIAKRPLVVEKITDKGMEGVTLNVDTAYTLFPQTVSSENNTSDPGYKPGFTLVDLENDSDYAAYAGKITGTPIYDDDKIGLYFVAKLTWDNRVPPYYTLPQGAAFGIRSAAIQDIKLADTTGEQGYPDNKNYTFVSLKTKTANATIKSNAIVSIDVENPPKLTYTSGEAVSFDRPMKIIVTYEDGKTVETVRAGATWLSSLGLSITCVEEKNNTPGAALEHGQALTADTHNGKYICISAIGGYKDGQPVYVCWYSKAPIQVTRKTLTLTVKPLTVYYGEFQDTMLDYTYDPAELAVEDRQKLETQLGRELQGTSDELKLLPNYVAPVLSAWKGPKSERVTIDTPVWWENGKQKDHLIYIENAVNEKGAAISGSSNYSFLYNQDKVPSTEYGTGTLTILPRPIIVDSVTLGKYSEAFLYDDTTSATLQEMYWTQDNSYVARPITLKGQNANRSGGDADAVAQANADTFVAILPGSAYYLAGVTGIKNNPYPLTGSAIHERKNADGVMTPDRVVVTYAAEYTKDNPSNKPPENPYFNMNGQTEKLTTAQVSALRLLPGGDNDNGNYTLVFQTQLSANSSRPRVNALNEVRVKLRPIKKTEIASDPIRLSYTYGELLDLGGLSLHIEYEREGDNAPEANKEVINRTVYYRRLVGSSPDTLAKQGLQVYWVMDQTLTIPETLSKADVDGYLSQKKLIPVSDNDGYPDVAKDGKRLIVLGRRYNEPDADEKGHVLVWSKSGDKDIIHVAKKTLPLLVADQNRFYGEANINYQAKFRLTDLAKPDQGKVTESPDAEGYFYLVAQPDPGSSNTQKEVSTSATSTVLSALNAPYLDGTSGGTTNLGVRFTTAGTQAGSAGQYFIDVDIQSGNMANYKFDHNTSATLRIFRRPIVINKICEKPISTIYWDTPQTNFSATVSQTGQKSNADIGKGFYTQLPILSSGLYESSDPEVVDAVNSGMNKGMPLSGAAIYGTDEVKLAMNVVFPNVADRNDFSGGNASKYQIDQSVTVRDMVLTGGSEKNYYLVWDPANAIQKENRSPINTGAVGQLDRRPITAIQILSDPKTEYTYGEALDLTALRLRVTYGVMTGTESYLPTDDLSYAQLAGRLSVNYWTSAMAPTDVDHYGDGTLRRAASTGDHLTIAPVHEKLPTDAQYYPADVQKGGFAHNGKYLILTARTDPSMAFTAPPVVVKTPLKIKPLDLTYRFKVEDKVYDETGYESKTAAKGSITLTNAYSETKTAPSGAGGTTTYDRDLIYVVTDETDAVTDWSSYLNDPSKDTAEKAYTFGATGAPGSKGLSFQFFDENVVYYDDTHTVSTPVAPKDWVAYWNKISHAPKTPSGTDWDSYGEVGTMPVLVSNIMLSGPDKANYTLDTAVGKKNDLSQNSDATKGKASVPYAKIEKAEQSITAVELPKVSVDAHTNTVRVTYETTIDSVRAGRNDKYNSELHYEYALEYQDPVTSTSLTQWGGTEAWADQPYFGGEKMSAELPEGYVPQEGNTTTPGKDEIVKGQAYPWEAEDTTFVDREPLKRDTVYWGMVRLAETHNYKASAAVQAANDILAEEADARQAAQEMSQVVQGWVENKPTEGETDPAHGPNIAVKTYQQSFKILSTEEKMGQDGKKYFVDTLEATWFTDIQNYAKKEELDAVLRNLVKTRYYNYYWDVDHSADIRFEDGGLDLTHPFDVDIKRKVEGGTAEEKLTVNKDDSAVIYVSVKRTGGGAQFPDEIVIVGGGGGGPAGEKQEDAYIVGGAPVTLKVEIKPSYALSEGLIWESSDPRVVQIDEKGTMYFVGVGTVTITATTRQSQREAKVTVQVTDPTGLSQGIGAGWETALELAQGEKNGFDFYYTGAFMSLDKEYQFHPTWTMTRGEMVSVLAAFYEPKDGWSWDGEVTFPDLTGLERYAQAAEVLRREGILTGLPDGSFGGEQTATRSEVAAVLCRMMELEPVKNNCTAFLDYGGIDTEWADRYVEALARADIVLGTGGDYFHPEREITREEAAAMLGRILLSGVYYDARSYIVPSDVEEEHWGYGLILRAVNKVVPRRK